MQGYSKSKSRKITPAQETQIKPPRQGKFQVLIRRTTWTDLTPQGRPFRYADNWIGGKLTPVSSYEGLGTIGNVPDQFEVSQSQIIEVVLKSIHYLSLLILKTPEET